MFNSLFSIGFRPFFLLATLHCIIYPILWASQFVELFSLPTMTLEPLNWHVHEMIFGFGGSLLAGFLLTASANWTGKSPWTGKYLVYLFIFWIVERIALFSTFSSLTIKILSLPFILYLIILLFITLKDSPKQRNVFIPLMLIFAIGKFLHLHFSLVQNFEQATTFHQVGLGMIRFIVLLIAGRVIPFFTRKRLPDLNINVPNAINLLALAPVFILIFEPFLNTQIRTGLYILALITNSIRFGYWLPHKLLQVSILGILPIGIFWILIHFALKILQTVHTDLTITDLPTHALMVGGLGTIALGIMSRVSLGHTGRYIEADLPIFFSYILINCAAFFRVVTPILSIDFLNLSITLTAICWLSAFLVHLFKFFKIWTSPRPDGKAY